ncbi:MAG: protein translocase subunit SecD [Nitrospirota bacterium]|nr:protein translocase subunit SecD [Nitrospirota bacterium]
MQKSIGGRLIAISLVSLLSLLYFLPSIHNDKLPGWTKAVGLGEGLTLGLDLQGGIHLVLRVEREVAVTNYLDRTIENLNRVASEEKLVGSAKRGEGLNVIFTNDGTEAARAELRELIGKRFGMLREALPPEGTSVHLALSDDEAERIRKGAVTQAVETIRNRIDQFGVAEPLIQQQGTDEILVQLPGVADPNRAIELIGKTALLEFRMVDEEYAIGSGTPLPEGDEILYHKVVDRETGLEIDREPYALQRRAMLTGDTLTDARVSIDQFNEPQVSIEFDAIGSKIFAQVTQDNVGKRFAIVLDGNVYSAPVIREAIPGGRAQISGSFTSAEANDLAIVLRAGALPAPVTMLQNVTVGPSLGADSIRAGLTATLAGLMLVILFMVVYYRLSGVLSIFAVFLNLVVLLGMLGAMHATLTLPGIAGILLTIGMGVDSNVLIFERIREELRLGKTVRLAVEQGYDRVLLTVVDAHVTTLITAAALFLFGSGPVKGFAVTLSMGILINLFTAFVGTKVFFDWLNSRRRVETLSI